MLPVFFFILAGACFAAYIVIVIVSSLRHARSTSLDLISAGLWGGIVLFAVVGAVLAFPPH